MDSNTDKQTSRRDFLKVAGATAAGLMVSGAARSTAYAIAPPKVIGANDRITIGHIGCGGQGQAHMRILKDSAKATNTASVAVSEIYDRRKNDAKGITGVSDGQVYHDYRKLLDQKDIDVVLIASPEHWHFKMATDALDAGKHVYLEKPMTRTAQEAIDLYKAVKAKPNMVLQVGSQITSDPKWHRAAELVKAGKIGKVLWSQDSYCRNVKEGEWNYQIFDDCTPQTLDWNAFLGNAPKHAFDKERYFRWRKYWDYSAGITSDLFPHRLHPLAIVVGAEWPKRVACVGGKYVQMDRDVPDTTIMTVDYPSGSTIVLAGCTANEQGLLPMVRGNKATMYLSGKSIQITPEKPYVDEIDPISEEVGTGTEDIGAHERNFFNTIRGTEKLNCGVDLAAPVMVAIALAEVSYRHNKIMQFDPAKLQVVGDDDLLNRHQVGAPVRSGRNPVVGAK